MHSRFRLRLYWHKALEFSAGNPEEKQFPGFPLVMRVLLLKCCVHGLPGLFSPNHNVSDQGKME